MEMQVTDVYYAISDAIDKWHNEESAKIVNDYYNYPDSLKVKAGDRYYRGIVLMGGSRSGKTFATIQKLTERLITQDKERITCWRNERVTCRSTVQEDFKTIKYSDTDLNEAIGENTARGRYYGRDTGSEIFFEGTDSIGKVLGMKQNISFFNEITEFNESVFKQITQRTSDFWIADYNPSRTFWLEPMLGAPDITVMHFTYEDNAFCPKPIIKQLRSYDPNVKVNIENGTANQYLYDVYCLGIKAEKPGRIYREWKEMPDVDYHKLPYDRVIGLDFGQVAPTGVVEVKFDGDNTIFLHEVLYEPINVMPLGLAARLNQVDQSLIEDEVVMVCDSAGKTRITKLQRAGFMALGARKGNHSVVPGIAIVQTYNIVYTRSSTNLKAEYEGYAWKLDRYGIPTDEPEKKYDHLMDAVRYVVEYVDTNFK
jgi:PBSX family phage terminase large subunit